MPKNSIMVLNFIEKHASIPFLSILHAKNYKTMAAMTLTFEISKWNINQIIAHIWFSICIDFQEDPAVLDFSMNF
jgi:hypothetical protein